VLAPAATQDLDGDDAAGLRFLGAENAAETSRCNLVQQPVATQEEAVRIAFEEFLTLPGGEEALALQGQQESLAVSISPFIEAEPPLILGQQSHFQGLLAEHGRRIVRHG